MNVVFLKRNLILILITFSLILIWWGIPFLQYGLFGDGVFYGNIARNLIFDFQSSIWDLKISNSLEKQFCGHPPFSFWVESIFFYFLGDHFWIERFYSLSCAIGTMYLIHKIWRLFYSDSSLIVIIIWLCFPIVGWTYANNMIECTLTILTSAAVFFILKICLGKLNFFYGIIFSVTMVFCALWTKGFVGLFPLITPIIFAIYYENKNLKSKLKLSSILVILLCLSFLLFIYFNHSAFIFLERYYENQLFPSLNGKDSVASNRFYILQIIILDALIPISIIVIGKLIILKLKIKSEPIDWSLFKLFFLIGLSASLPIIISPKQLNFYSIPSIVFFSLSLGVIAHPIYQSLICYLEPFKKLKKTSFLLILILNIGLSYVSINNYKGNARDFEILHDIRIIGTIVPRHSEIYLSPSLFKFWNLHGYFYRFYYIDLNTVNENQEYAIIPNFENGIELESRYTEIKLNLKIYRLYKKIKTT